MNRLIFMCSILLGCFTSNSVMASVTVTVNTEQYVFEHEPHLIEVLAPIANQKDWYWPSTALYRQDDSQLEKTRQLLLNSLSSLIVSYRKKNSAIAQSLEQLQNTIANWRLGRRLLISIDYDLARIVESKNPQLPHGKYILGLATRKDSVQLFGAVNKTINIPNMLHADVSEYIANQIRTDLAEKDFVTIIQADGRKITAPIAYWNKKHQEVMPGSQLFVPFKTSLFEPKFELINKQIETLALNRLQ